MLHACWECWRTGRLAPVMFSKITGSWILPGASTNTEPILKYFRPQSTPWKQALGSEPGKTHGGLHFWSLVSGLGNCYLVICGHRPLQWVNRMLVHDGDMFRPQYSALLYHWKNLVCHFIVFNFLLLHYFWNWEGRNKTAFVHRCRDCLWENPKESVKKSSWN